MTGSRSARHRSKFTPSYRLVRVSVASTVGGLLIVTAILCLSATAVDPPTSDPFHQVGPAPDDGTYLPNGQTIHPAGQTILYASRPLDLCLSPDRTKLFVKNNNALTVFDTDPWRLHQTLPIRDEFGSIHGIVSLASPDGTVSIYMTCAKHALLEARLGADGAAGWSRHLDLPGPLDGDSHPLGIAISSDRTTAYVCLSINNTLGVVDLVNWKLLVEVPVGVCPYDVALLRDGKTAFVTNFGGARPAVGVTTADSAGTAVAVDDHSFALSGTVSVVDLKARKELKQITVGLHPAQIILTRDGLRAFVANANSDSISMLDTAGQRVTETMPTRLGLHPYFGAVTNSLALSDDDTTLFAANAGENAIAVFKRPTGNSYSRVADFLPTGWFPGGVICDGKTLFVVNTKGDGSRTFDKAHDGWNSLRLQGSVSKMASHAERITPEEKNPPDLAVIPGEAVGQVPVPTRLGEHSVFHHVIYVIKENRTYDQIFGDLKEGNAETRLCTYGREVTPNAHAIVEQFALLDNYYCNGVRSADGHQWATQGMVTDYQEKDLSGSVRSYDFGTDALCFAPTPFIWDSVLLAGLSFRNYGEFCFPTFKQGRENWFETYNQWKLGHRVPMDNGVKLAEMAGHSCLEYPGWNLNIPDVYRIQFFLDELKKFQQSGQCPNFMIVYLPQDHTHGVSPQTPTPRAMVADNDLALGKLVDAVSRSRFWADTCIFVNEDDPQNGLDHVDGHRSTCLIASPYTKRGQVISRFFNQTSVLHTICRIFGLGPMNQMVAMAPTMEDCFCDKADLSPYTAVPNRIPLDEVAQIPHAAGTEQSKLLEQVSQMRWSRPDLNDDDTLNRLLWSASRPGEAYPAQFAGAHGAGLRALGLSLDKSIRHSKQNDDDD